MAALMFSEIKENAREIIGNITMKSWLNRITEQLPYFAADIEEVRIIILDDTKSSARVGGGE